VGWQPLHQWKIAARQTDDVSDMAALGTLCREAQEALRHIAYPT